MVVLNVSLYLSCCVHFVNAWGNDTLYLVFSWQAQLNLFILTHTKVLCFSVSCTKVARCLSTGQHDFLISSQCLKMSILHVTHNYDYIDSSVSLSSSYICLILDHLFLLCFLVAATSTLITAIILHLHWLKLTNLRDVNAVDNESSCFLPASLWLSQPHSLQQVL